MDLSKESRILIVGGLGYVGGRLSHYLASQGYSDVNISTVRDSYPEWTDSYDIVKLDLGVPESVEKTIISIQPDIIIHLGAMQQAQCQSDPEGAVRINEHGLEKMLDAAQQCGVQRYVFISSFQVYGDFLGTITEETIPNPQTIYAQTKFRGEQIVQQYREKGLSTIVLRLANAYGYPVDNEIAESAWTLAVNAFCRRVVSEGKLTIKSNQYRDFIAMFDAVRGIEHAMNLKLEDSKDGIFNLGGENCVQVRDVAQRVVRIYAELDAQADPTIEGPLENIESVFEPFDYRIDKFRETGFELQGDMDQAIRATLQFCLQHVEV